jgi:hypothetical protein
VKRPARGSALILSAHDAIAVGPATCAGRTAAAGIRAARGARVKRSAGRIALRQRAHKAQAIRRAARSDNATASLCRLPRSYKTEDDDGRRHEHPQTQSGRLA